MTRHEKLVLFLVIILVVMKLGLFGRDLAIARIYGALGPSDYEKLLWQQYSLLWGALVNIASGVWLFIEARAAALKAWVWALLGLCFGLLGVVLFYVIQTYGHRNERA